MDENSLTRPVNVDLLVKRSIQYAWRQLQDLLNHVALQEDQPADSQARELLWLYCRSWREVFLRLIVMVGLGCTPLTEEVSEVVHLRNLIQGQTNMLQNLIEEMHMKYAQLMSHFPPAPLIPAVPHTLALCHTANRFQALRGDVSGAADSATRREAMHEVEWPSGLPLPSSLGTHLANFNRPIQQPEMPPLPSDEMEPFSRWVDTNALLQFYRSECPKDELVFETAKGKCTLTLPNQFKVHLRHQFDNWEVLGVELLLGTSSSASLGVTAPAALAQQPTLHVLLETLLLDTLHLQLHRIQAHKKPATACKREDAPMADQPAKGDGDGQQAEEVDVLNSIYQLLRSCCRGTVFRYVLEAALNAKHNPYSPVIRVDLEAPDKPAKARGGAGNEAAAPSLAMDETMSESSKAGTMAADAGASEGGTCRLDIVLIDEPEVKKRLRSLLPFLAATPSPSSPSSPQPLAHLQAALDRLSLASICGGHDKMETDDGQKSVATSREVVKRENKDETMSVTSSDHGRPRTLAARRDAVEWVMQVDWDEADGHLSVSLRPLAAFLALLRTQKESAAARMTDMKSHLAGQTTKDSKEGVMQLAAGLEELKIRMHEQERALERLGAFSSRLVRSVCEFEEPLDVLVSECVQMVVYGYFVRLFEGASGLMAGDAGRRLEVMLGVD
ncbi:unnamed protein product [Vitrella brassicaformis CCMP3155]|uniref:Mediator of RNA polymerase II transcription subunit 14 n=2 Tax=Vitrella brassicaformis TaxID=1169539 RepID=A0A0G4ENW2_VITBC|nr:unnamed protein product [Vitrella brassicaformis CCMP3155]|eukprot:CEL99131.1 unnamed protein product [Vitrella brassicaformis CCMP3155]